MQAFAHDVDPETVGQFTGLHDKNGKEIYEGDVIELVNEAGETIRIVCRFGEAIREIYENKVQIIGFYFEMPDGRKCFPIVKNYKGCNDVELYNIIGNVHDNPELLK